MRRDDPTKVVLVCRWKGHDDRFFGKYKSFDAGKWIPIPGGVFPPEFDTRPKAMVFAELWYADKLAEHQAKIDAAKIDAAKVPSDPTWDDICDAYIAEVQARMRGKGSTRYEAISSTNGSIRKGLLATGKPNENDETRCLEWLRTIATENIAKKPGETRNRKPMTVRNIAKHLRYLFRLALRRKLIPGLTSNPMLGEDIREELRALVAGAEQRDWLVPHESFAKLVVCKEVPAERRIVQLVLGLTGLRPGELAGLQFKHVFQDSGVCMFVIDQQWTLGRGKAVKEGLGTLKTRWARRVMPLHAALHAPLAQWVAMGWVAWVGREPTREDFIFPRPDGTPLRETSADTFREDLKRAGCPTEYEGLPLKPYALRHLFSTMLAEGGANGAAHDRLLGHRPSDTKGLNYTAKLAPFLAAEVARIGFELPPDAPSFGAPSPA
jgi:integrase